MNEQYVTPSGSMPEHVLNLISEYAVGGFILFHFNSVTDEPEYVSSFDSKVYDLAMQKYVADWSEILHKVRIESSVINIQESLGEEGGEELGGQDPQQGSSA